eukprot:6746698-Prymnesium_polylepis.1
MGGSDLMRSNPLLAAARSPSAREPRPRGDTAHQRSRLCSTHSAANATACDALPNNESTACTRSQTLVA